MPYSFQILADLSSFQHLHSDSNKCWICFSSFLYHHHFPVGVVLHFEALFFSLLCILSVLWKSFSGHQSFQSITNYFTGSRFVLSLLWLLRNILFQVEKAAQSLGCDYWFHHLCYLGIFLKAAVWSVLEDNSAFIVFPQDISQHLWICVWFLVHFLVCWFGFLGFFVGLILQRAFHLICFEPTSQQYLTLAKVVHRHTYERNN